MPTVIGWVRHLQAKIEKQTSYAAPYDQRYRNEYVLPFIQQEYAEVYGSDAVAQFSGINPPRSGTAAIGIDALTERLTVLGATTQGQSDDEKRAVQLVNQAWEDSDLDVMHREAPREAMIGARSFGLVTRATDGERAIGSVESAQQCAVHRQAAPPYDTDAFLKIRTDEWTGRRLGLLLLPGLEYDLAEGDETVADPEDAAAPWSRWRVIGDPRPGLKRVPAFEFAHMARLLAEPVSEIERIVTEVDIVDLIEGLLVFAGHFGAVPIRFATGLEVPRDPKDPSKPATGPDGRPLLGFNPRADHLWVSTSKDARFGQLTPAGLESFVKWGEHASGKIRAQTKVASTYYSLELKSHMSAELLKTDEAPMIRRIRSIGPQGTFGQSWRRFQQTMLEIEDPALARKVRLSPLWEDPQTRVESQAVDAYQKAVASGMGARYAARMFLGLSPEEADKAVAEAEDAARKKADEEAARKASADPIAAALLRDAGVIGSDQGA